MSDSHRVRLSRMALLHMLAGALRSDLAYGYVLVTITTATAALLAHLLLAVALILGVLDPPAARAR